VYYSNHAFLRSSVAQHLQNQLRFTASADLTLAYIDVLYDERSDAQVPIGQPRLPLVLLLAGNGSYTNPYYLGAVDFVASTAFIVDAWLVTW
jgi:predicted dienelactone hydrolase